MSTSEIVRVPLPTPFGVFQLHAFEQVSGHVYLALVMGDVAGDDVLVRVHSECLTGDVLSSLRCDCGVQLRRSMQAIATEQRGVLVYVTGHEGRGIGLVNKLRAYAAQDRGADTVDANLELGLPIDSRDYTDTAGVLDELGVRTIRLMTNNPCKVSGLRSAGATVDTVVPLPTAPHHRNHRYVRTKSERLGHLRPAGAPLPETVGDGEEVDPIGLLGPIRPRQDRPYVVLKYAQTLDGRIATATGDSRWISGEPERRLSHALRAAVDAVLVGAGTALTDDPQLTVRMVSGASPTRVVLDSRLRVPIGARIFGPEAATTVLTTPASDGEHRDRLRQNGVRVAVVDAGPRGVDLAAALADLRGAGVETVLVEGGSGVITSFLAAGLVDRLIVAIAPLMLGTGIEAVGDLGVARVADGTILTGRSIHPVGDDVVLAWDVAGRQPPEPATAPTSNSTASRRA
jgi:3,4-dihydroxy 2-butanone 4-phosphate synthase/GTP cyclohydrolase II